MKLRRTSLQCFLAIALAAAATTIHWGVDEYRSVQFAMFLLLALFATQPLLINWARVAMVATATVIVVGVSAVFANHEYQLVMKGLRTGAVICLILALQRRSTRRDWIDWSVIAERAIFIACAAAALLATLQLVDSLAFNLGYFDIPESWFSLDYGTLFAERRESLARFQYFVRPAAFFSEPSALAILGLLGLVVSYSNENTWLKLISIWMALVSYSLIGMLFTILLVLWHELYSKGSSQKRLFAFVAAATVVFFVAESVVIEGRLSAVLSGEDVSARIRLLNPVILMGHIFGSGFFLGVSHGYAIALMPADVTTIFSNWAFNQFIYYGVLGVVMLALPFFAVSRRLWFLLIVFMVANGDAFYYDRLYLLVLGVFALRVNTGGFPVRTK